MGIGFICMEGNIEFYKHAGFGLASKLNIHYHAEPKDAEVPYFLAQELIPGWLGGIEATYCPPQGYFVADAQPEAAPETEAPAETEPAAPETEPAAPETEPAAEAPEERNAEHGT